VIEVEIERGMGEKQEVDGGVLSNGRLSSVETSSNILMYVYTTIFGYLEYIEGKQRK